MSTSRSSMNGKSHQNRATENDRSLRDVGDATERMETTPEDAVGRTQLLIQSQSKKTPVLEPLDTTTIAKETDNGDDDLPPLASFAELNLNGDANINDKHDPKSRATKRRRKTIPNTGALQPHDLPILRRTNAERSMVRSALLVAAFIADRADAATEAEDSASISSLDN